MENPQLTDPFAHRRNITKMTHLDPVDPGLDAGSGSSVL